MFAAQNVKMFLRCGPDRPLRSPRLPLPGQNQMLHRPPSARQRNRLPRRRRPLLHKRNQLHRRRRLPLQKQTQLPRLRLLPRKQNQLPRRRLQPRRNNPGDSKKKREVNLCQTIRMKS
jgi:hypothetical protein